MLIALCNINKKKLNLKILRSIALKKKEKKYK